MSHRTQRVAAILGTVLALGTAAPGASLAAPSAPQPRVVAATKSLPEATLRRCRGYVAAIRGLNRSHETLQDVVGDIDKSDNQHANVARIMNELDDASHTLRDRTREACGDGFEGQ